MPDSLTPFKTNISKEIRAWFKVRLIYEESYLTLVARRPEGGVVRGHHLQPLSHLSELDPRLG
jgi:hypothetical protein